MKFSKNNISSIAAAMALSLAPVPADSVGSYMATSPSQNTLVLQNINDSVVYLPITEARQYMADLANRMRGHLRNLRAEWEKKRIPIDDKSMSKFARDNLHYFTKHITLCAALVKASKIALNQVDDQKHCQEIMQFGRAAADLRYTIEEILSFTKNTHESPKLIEITNQSNKEDVQALISSEHQALGLDKPIFH
ncbi:hypothetical protein [Xenorhabdus doucetiae]|uniref:Uncharacterized protein n=1 Tax=Xenorhabdus doucetiae TaxID=351671 RepID=A0A068QPY8_9GAMM|nr:hypothetical protein [Xenorhabdus doucetiae]TYP07799.1 hypothetical protein LY16_01594 [Xenorhabdus doucetiae]CDG15885.1 conserved exported protein of unknown function [Xenorhabdus doucetiae]